MQIRSGLIIVISVTNDFICLQNKKQSLSLFNLTNKLLISQIKKLFDL